MSGVRGIKRKRKYYKRCMYMDAFRFAPTGAIQPRERFAQRDSKLEAWVFQFEAKPRTMGVIYGEWK